MDRRTFLCGLTLGTLSAPAVAEAQTTGKVFRLGILGQRSPTTPEGRLWDAFLEALHELGYIQGQNITVVGRYSEGRYERLPSLAAELVRLKVDVIVAGGSPMPEMAKRASSTIPIVMTGHGDPVGSGLVASLARPGRNVTGLSTISQDLIGKQLQLFKEAVPKISRVAILSNPTGPLYTRSLREAEAAARSLQIRLQIRQARTPSDFAGAFSAMTNESAEALVLLPDPMFFVHRARIGELAAEHRLPAMAGSREFAEAGGLMAYGVSLTDNFRRAAVFVDKILRGAKPSDLPVEQPTKFELVISLRTAKALGLTIPQTLLLRADQVIE